MIPDLLNYKMSILNPMLKLLTPLLFLWGTYYAYKASRRYRGEIGKLMRALALVGVAGFLANLFRYLGDVMTMWKWGESIGYLLFCIVNLYAAWYAAGPLVKFVRGMISESFQTGGNQ